jgi:hypothetical protein
MRMRSLAGPRWRERTVNPHRRVSGLKGHGGTAGTSSEADAVSSRVVAIALAVSWLGLWAHEVYRVPDRAGLTPDGSLPMLGVLVGLLVLGRAFPRPSTLLVGAGALGTLHLLGAVLTVLPFGFDNAEEWTLPQFRHWWRISRMSPVGGFR